MEPVAALLTAGALIFALPFLIWRLSGASAAVPLVIVQIVGGFVLGPEVLGRAYPAAFEKIFHPAALTGIECLSTWSVMLLVWVAGVELDPKLAWGERRETLVTALCALGIPFLTSCAVLLSLVSAGGPWAGPSSWQAVLGVAIALSVTSLPILIEFMDWLGIRDQPIGQRILAYASIDDVFAWAALAFVLLDWQRLSLQLGFAICFVPAALLVRRVVSRARASDRWYLAVVWMIVASLSAEAAGLHFIIGAFLAGFAIEAEWMNPRKLAEFRSATIHGLLPFFFLNAGLQANWELSGAGVLVLAAAFLAASLLSKLLAVRLAGTIFGWSEDKIRLVGWMLQAKGVLMILFATVLRDRGLITPQLFTSLLLAAVVSTALTIPVLARRSAARVASGEVG